MRDDASVQNMFAKKFGPQKTKGIPSSDKAFGSEGPWRYEASVLGAVDLLDTLRYLRAMEQALHLVRAMKREGVGAPCGHAECTRKYYATVVEAIMLVNGYRMRAQSISDMLRAHPAMRRTFHRAFTPWWSRRPYWWPFG